MRSQVLLEAHVLRGFTLSPIEGQHAGWLTNLCQNEVVVWAINILTCPVQQLKAAAELAKRNRSTQPDPFNVNADSFAITTNGDGLVNFFFLANTTLGKLTGLGIRSMNEFVTEQGCDLLEGVLRSCEVDHVNSELLDWTTVMVRDYDKSTCHFRIPFVGRKEESKTYEGLDAFAPRSGSYRKQGEAYAKFIQTAVLPNEEPSKTPYELWQEKKEAGEDATMYEEEVQDFTPADKRAFMINGFFFQLLSSKLAVGRRYFSNMMQALYMCWSTINVRHKFLQTLVACKRGWMSDHFWVHLVCCYLQDFYLPHRAAPIKLLKAALLLLDQPERVLNPAHYNLPPNVDFDGMTRRELLAARISYPGLESLSNQEYDSLGLDPLAQRFARDTLIYVTVAKWDNGGHLPPSADGHRGLLADAAKKFWWELVKLRKEQTMDFWSVLDDVVDKDVKLYLQMLDRLTVD